MRLSTRMRYGTRGLLELALHYDQGPLSVTEIAEQQALSVKYLENLLGRLHAGGLVRSLRGAQGGYELSRPPGEITLRRVFDVLEGAEAFVPCTDDHTMCTRWPDCVTQQVWAKMHAAAMQVLEETTLADLAAQARARHGILAYDI
jgi:Rrf2 family transcriptional regulator, cysteine metabolism repressor